LLIDEVQISVKDSWNQQDITHEILFIFTSEFSFRVDVINHVM